jgi:hypothetical protein
MTYTDSLGILRQRPTEIVNTAELKLYPGWTARVYADGQHDAIHTDGRLTRPRRSWRGMLDEVRGTGSLPDTELRRAQTSRR